MMLGGWVRLWLVVTLTAIVAAVILAFWMPDLYASVNDKKRLSGPKPVEFSYTTTLSDETMTFSNCLVGSLHESVDEEADGWIIDGGFHCTSYSRLYSFVGISLVFSLTLLVLGLAVRWVRKGFQRPA